MLRDLPRPPTARCTRPAVVPGLRSDQPVPGRARSRLARHRGPRRAGRSRGEYGSGTIRSSLAAMPRRLRVPGARRRRRASHPGHRRGAELPVASSRARPSSRAAAPTASLGQPGVLRAVLLSGAFLALFRPCSGWASAPSSATPPAPSRPSSAVTFLVPVLLHHVLGEPGPVHPRTDLGQLGGGVGHESTTRSRPHLGFVLDGRLRAAALAPARPCCWPAGRMTRTRRTTAASACACVGAGACPSPSPRSRLARPQAVARPPARAVHEAGLVRAGVLPRLGGLAGVGLAFVAATMVAGVVLAITFFGLAVLALSLRERPRHRRLARAWPAACSASDRGPRALRRAARLPRLAAVALARPRGLARRRLPGPQGPVVAPRRPGSRSACGGTPRSASSTRSSGGTRQRAGLRPLRNGFFPARSAIARAPPATWPSSLRRRLLVRRPWVMRWFVNVDRLLMRAPARSRSHGGPGAHPRAGPDPDRRRLGRHAAPHRAGPARRHPGPAGGARHAAGHGQGEARPTPTTSTSSRSASWWTRPTGGPRKPSPSCATSLAASTRRRSTSAWRARWPPWPPGAPSPPSFGRPCTPARRRRSRPSPTSAWPSSWPTWPSTPGRRGRRSAARSRDLAAARRARRRPGRARSDHGRLLVERPGRADRPGAGGRRPA